MTEYDDIIGLENNGKYIVSKRYRSRAQIVFFDFQESLATYLGPVYNIPWLIAKLLLLSALFLGVSLLLRYGNKVIA